jgi:hypothetical protein
LTNSANQNEVDLPVVRNLQQCGTGALQKVRKNTVKTLPLIVTDAQPNLPDTYQFSDGSGNKPVAFKRRKAIGNILA